MPPAFITSLIAIAIAFLAHAGRLPGADSNTGKIRIDCEAGIAVQLDGKPAKTTTYGGRGATLDGVPVGLRKIGISKPEFQAEEHAVTIEPGKTEVLAFFFLKPDPAAPTPPAATLADPLAALAEAGRSVEHAADRVRDMMLPRSLAGRTPEETLANASAHTTEIRLASAGREAALREQAEVEARVAAQFRIDYAAFHALRARRSATSDEKRAAWGGLLATWKLPPDLGPSALVWRNHRVEAARGNLRVKLAASWPVGLEAPVRILDGRPLPAEPANPLDPAFWEIRDLTAAPHTLRLEHPALEPTEGTLLVVDSKTVVVTWALRFKSAAP